MKKLLIVLFGALILYACEQDKESFQEDEISNLELKSKNGLTKSDALPFPIWARMGAGAPYGIPTDGEYGIIYFYVDPYSIPLNSLSPPYPAGDHNLLNWFDPRATSPGVEFTVEGYSWHQPENNFPHHMHLKGKGAVPFWIITFDQVLEVIEDGIVTIAELDALPSPWPLKGLATSFTENLRPYGGGAPINGITSVSNGQLEDGRKFSYKYHTKIKPGEELESKVNLKIY